MQPPAHCCHPPARPPVCTLSIQTGACRLARARLHTQRHTPTLTPWHVPLQAHTKLTHPLRSRWTPKPHQHVMVRTPSPRGRPVSFTLQWSPPVDELGTSAEVGTGADTLPDLPLEWPGDSPPDSTSLGLDAAPSSLFIVWPRPYPEHLSPTLRVTPRGRRELAGLFWDYRASPRKLLLSTQILEMGSSEGPRRCGHVHTNSGASVPTGPVAAAQACCSH